MDGYRDSRNDADHCKKSAHIASSDYAIDDDDH